jgi:hypothetical protein
MDCGSWKVCMKGVPSLAPPRTEADSFVVEAALQLGAKFVDEDATTLQMSETTLMELARRVRHSYSTLPISAHHIADLRAAGNEPLLLINDLVKSTPEWSSAVNEIYRVVRHFGSQAVIGVFRPYGIQKLSEATFDQLRAITTELKAVR